MISIRRSDERGHYQSDWLDSRHTFSFDTYYDPRHMGFRDLRVINEDHVRPGHGFPLHRHENMEVLSLILEGSLKHEDDLGHGAVIGPGEVQRFSAGTGIRHSEYNPSAEETVHFLQIWILPARRGLTPGYEQKRFGPAMYRNRLGLIGSADGREGSITIHQAVDLFRASFDSEGELDYSLAPGRHAWIQVIQGPVSIHGIRLETGDGASMSEEERLRIVGEKQADLLLFDLS